MATRTQIFSSDTLHTKINQKSGSKLVQVEKFTLSVAAPDDRRLDGAFADHKSLAADLTKLCEKAAAVLVEACARSMAAFEKRVKSDRSSEPMKARLGLGFLVDHTWAFEKSVETGCDKIWKQFVSSHAALRGVRFKPVVVYPEIFAAVAELDSKQDERVPMGADYESSAAALLQDWSALAKKADAGLKEKQDSLAAASSNVAEINQTLDKLMAAYKAAPRESQQDNPDTAPEEEPDESKLNEALFSRFDPAIEDASGKLWKGSTDLGAAELAANSTTKEFNAFLKRYAKTLTMILPGAQTKQKLERTAAQSNEVVNALVGLTSKLKVARKEYENSKAVFRALQKHKDAALGLLDRVKLSGAIPLKELEDARKLLKPLIG